MEDLNRNENLPNSTSSPVTDGSEAYPKRWYALRTHTNCERRAQKILDHYRIENYVPSQKEVRQWSDRKKVVERLLMPMIVFIYADEAQLKQAICTPLVYEALKAPGDAKPTPIPTDQIQTLKYMVGNSDSPVTIETNVIKLGDKVEIARGKLKGITGYVTEMKENSTRIVVQIDLIGWATIQIDSMDIKLCK